MTKKESIFILFSITLCWSSSYIFIKDIPQSFSVYAYLALTSGVAGIILALVMRRKFRLLNKVSLRQGLILGVLITLSNMFEKLGLDQIPASSASVYASMGIIIVPLRMRGFVSNQWSPAICLADTVVMGITFFMIRRGIGFTGNPLMMVLGVLTIACILLTCMMQGKEANV